MIHLLNPRSLSSPACLAASEGLKKKGIRFICHQIQFRSPCFVCCMFCIANLHLLMVNTFNELNLKER